MTYEPENYYPQLDEILFSENGIDYTEADLIDEAEQVGWGRY